MQAKLYSLQLEGINCTNCENKILQGLKKIQNGLLKASVAILQQKLNVLVESDQVLDQVIQIISKMYVIKGEPILLEGGDQNIRSAVFICSINSESEKLEKTLKDIPGMEQVMRVHTGQSIKLTVNYNSKIIKGREIADQIEKADPNYQVINRRVQSFRKKKSVPKDQNSIAKTAILCSFFVIFDMILPFTGKWWDYFSVTPIALGPFSFAVMINLTIALYTLNEYAKPIIKRSYSNYFSSGMMDMETLISLGCLSAFFLFCFFMAKYIFDFTHGQFDFPAKSILEINHALASSSIIVLVVNIGKFFEDKVKRKIQQMTDSIFPESTLFEHLTVDFAKLKNWKMAIAEFKEYQVGLLEENDLFKIKSGRRLLLDSIVKLGKIETIKSTIDGNDEVTELSQGDRIQSGSIIVSSSEDALLEVQNVFEKGMLIEIGTHIKLGQIQQKNSQSGIQALCKTISRYFVKSVIGISLLVMLSWLFLLSFNFVRVPGCNFCWIVQRGIGVLVASCPCALGLAVPSVVAIVLNIAIKNGILIRNSGVLEKIKKCRIIAFDKTGTLFTRINKIEQYQIFNDQISEQILWQIIAVIEKPIKHPIAEILYKQAYTRSKVQNTKPSAFLKDGPIIRQNGLFSKITIKNKKEDIKILLGNKHLLSQQGIQVPKFANNSLGATQLYLSIDGKVYMALAINTHSNLRPQALKFFQILRTIKEIHILSGDSKESVEKLGQKLNIPAQNLHPKHSSEMKMQWIQRIQNTIESTNGIGVVMVGDGLNDIECLQEAAIGISINAKSQLNISASDVIMLSEDLYKILAFLNLLKKGNTFININLFWAFLYNIIMMPMVAGLFYGFDITISPIWSSVAMSCSSIVVVAFSHLLSFFQYDESKKMKRRQSEREKVSMTNESEASQRPQLKQNYGKFQEELQ